MKISHLSLWYDSGFTEGAIEVPAIGSSLPAADIELDELRVSRGRFFDKLRVPIDYLSAYNLTYLLVEVEASDLTNAFFYGWIDDVQVYSDTDTPECIISWHVDLWRTYIGRAHIGAGIITRRAASGELPPQPYPFRYIEASGESVELPASPSVSFPIRWVYLQIVRTFGTAEASTSSVLTACYPVNLNFSGPILKSGEIEFPNVVQTVTGDWDEALKIDPKSVVSACICPYAPTDCSVSSDGTVSLDSWEASVLAKEPSGAVGVFVPTAGAVENGTMFSPRRVSLASAMASGDTSTWQLSGWDRELIGAVPWGVEVGYLEYRIIAGSSGMYVQVRGGIDSADVANAHLRGTCWTVPMVPIDTTDNALSSYVYSGAKDADLQQLILNADQARVSGHLSTGTAGMSGAIGGAIMGGGVGAVAGAAVGAVANVAATEIGYRYQVGEFADRSLAISAYKAANQTNGLLSLGAVVDYLIVGDVLRFREMVTDEYSQQVRASDMRTYGAHVAEPVDEVDAYVVQGPLQVSNAVVGGPIPSAARDYIRKRLSLGVVIK